MVDGNHRIMATLAKAFWGNWYFTDDKAYRDEEGYFWFIGQPLSSQFLINNFPLKTKSNLKGVKGYITLR